MLWSQKRMFFGTPQTVEKDIEKGYCPMNKIVCVVSAVYSQLTGKCTLKNANR